MNTINVSLDELFFDPNNYRLQNNLRYEKIEESNIKSKAIQKRTFELITGGKQKKHSQIRDLLNSMKTNGFLKVDNILTRKLDNGGYLIIEGNRRLAALKVLYDEQQNGYEIGSLSPSLFEKPDNDKDKSKGVEVVVVKDDSEHDYYGILMGLKHVSGNKKWHRFNQAKLLYNLYSEFDYTFSDIAFRIGIDSASQVKNEIMAYGVMLDYIEFVKNQEITYVNFDPFDKYMIFLTLLSKPKFRDWLNWNEKSICFKNKNNRLRFYSWITPTEILDEDSEEDINYIRREPSIDNHKDIRILADYLKNEDFLKTMEETGSFQNTLNNDIRHSQKQFSSKIQSIYNAIKTINIENMSNMSIEDKDLFDKINQSLQKLITFKD